MKSFRSWSSVDSVDPNDVRRLCETEAGSSAQKPAGRCVSTWTFSLVVLIISVFLLVGLFVGYYIHDGQSYTDTHCDFTVRTDGFDADRLEMVHENVMYLMSGRRITDTAGKMTSVITQKSGESSDKRMVTYIHETLRNLRLDKVETTQYTVEVPSLDADNPSEITLSKSEEEVLVLKYGGKNSTEPLKKEGGPIVAIPGRARGQLVYGFYGRRQDIYHIQKSNISLKNCVLLLKLGEISILEKIRLASMELVSGILLYQDPSDSAMSLHELESVAYELKENNFHIPVQLVTSSDSNRMLRELHDGGVTAPDEWASKTGEKSYLGINPNNATFPAVVVEMKVNVIYTQETISNVLGTIYGDMESDRFVVIGAVRDESSAIGFDLGLGTAHLLEMAQAFANIKFAEKWGPRRGVRFCSWGGGKSLQGLSEYIKANKYVFGEQTIAYIDLDLYIERSSTEKTMFEVASSPALHKLIQHVLHQVPHPEDKQLTIADWQYDQPFNPFVSHGNQVVRNTLHNQGTVVISVGYSVQQIKDDEETSAVLRDSEHHDQYHLAASRVISLLALQLMDDQQLPLNLGNYTKFIHDVFGRSLVDLSNAEANVDIEMLSNSIDDLSRIGKAFQDFVSSDVNKGIPLGIRRMNDIKMGVDKILTSPQELRYTSPLLYDTAPDGSSQLLKEAIKTASITKDWDHAQHIVSTINRALQEVMSYLQLS